MLTPQGGSVPYTRDVAMTRYTRGPQVSGRVLESTGLYMDLS